MHQQASGTAPFMREGGGLSRQLESRRIHIEVSWLLPECILTKSLGYRSPFCLH